MNEVILTSLLFFIKKLLELVNIKKLQHQRIMQSSFWYIRVISITCTQFVQTCSLQFFFGCSQLVSEWLWFESFLATACPTNKYGWDCTKTCFCKNSLHCNRYTGPTDKCECKDGYFNPPFCQAGNPALLPKFPLSNLF